ncbi:MAG: hypothetical protein C0438_02655 [Pseudomonas sp.]|nr:hypothetical protein [Pseudomonas sp.]
MGEIPVGASLLAKAVGQSLLMLEGPTSSRAGSLSQGICGAIQMLVKKQPPRCTPCSLWPVVPFTQVIHRQFHSDCG